MFAARPGKPGREPFEPPFLSQGKQGKAPALHTTIGCGFESPKTLTPWRRDELHEPNDGDPSRGRRGELDDP